MSFLESAGRRLLDISLDGLLRRVPQFEGQARYSWYQSKTMSEAINCVIGVESDNVLSSKNMLT